MLNQRANAQQSRKADEEAWKKFKKERDLALKREEAAKNLSHLIAYQKDKRVRELKERQKQKDAENLNLGKSVKRLKGDLKDTVKGRSKLEQKLRQELKALREQNKKLQKELVVLKEAEPTKQKNSRKQKGERIEENAKFYSCATEDDELDFETDDESRVPNGKVDSKLRKVDQRKRVDRRAAKDASKNASTKQPRENKKERKQSKDDVKRPTSSKTKARKHSGKAQRDAPRPGETVKKQNRPRSREENEKRQAKKQNRPISREENEKRRVAKKNRSKRAARHQDDGFDSYSDDDFEDTENEGESNRQNIGEKKSRLSTNNTRKGQTEATVGTKEAENKAAFREKTDGTGGDRAIKGGDRKVRGQDEDLSDRQARRTKRETNGRLIVDNGETSDSGANNDGDRQVGRRKDAGKTRPRGGKGGDALLTSDSEDSEQIDRMKGRDRKQNDKGKSDKYTEDEATRGYERQKEYERGRGNKNDRNGGKHESHSEKHRRGQLAQDSSSATESDTDPQHHREKRGKTKTQNRTDHDGHGLPQITLTDDKNTVSLISKQSSTKAPTLDFRQPLQESGDEREGRKKLGNNRKPRDDHVTNSHEVRGSDAHRSSYGKSYEPENSAYGPAFSQSHRRQADQFAKDGGGPHSDLRTDLSYKKRLVNKSEWEKFLSENADHVSGVKGMSDGKNRSGVPMATHGNSFPMSYPPNITNNSPGHFGHSLGHKKGHYNGISVPGDKPVFPTGRRKKSSRKTDDDFSDDSEESSDVMGSFLGSPVDVNAKIRQYRERAEKIDVQLRRNQRVGMFAVQPAGKTVKERRVYPTTRILFRTYRNPGQPRATL
ncbi:micronuclear linker histone polyprotein-like [Branchiostoma lanceolatum]|uniref:micronuclear linker histone polyprotein-like n=1 Tax=Branchiostoma lanceolatum TaxID=7740 RepID=UPI003454E440